MNNDQNNLEQISNSIINLINEFVPDIEKIEIIQNKIMNNEELDFKEKEILERIKILNLIYKANKR